jgi:hypothetical protein
MGMSPCNLVSHSYTERVTKRVPKRGLPGQAPWPGPLAASRIKTTFQIHFYNKKWLWCMMHGRK